MHLLDDAELLSAFVIQRSEAAFEILVERHVGLVYSSALRQVRDPHLAEEITQAVFIILARKAGQLDQKTIVAGWLCRTARYAACNALKAERRRQHWEQEAHMNSIPNEPEPDVWPQVAPLLDEAVAQLPADDRNAVVLRYYQQKPLEDVGRALGLNASAAQKRVSRALEKLNTFFVRRGVGSTPEAIARAISTYSLGSVPSLLAKSVAATALGKSAVAGSSTLTLVKTTLIAMNAKTITATVDTMVILAGLTTWLAGTHLFHQSPPAATGIPGETIPVQFANDQFVARTNAEFAIDMDPNTLRTTNSAPAGHIKSLVKMDANGSSAWYLNPGTNATFLGSATSTIGFPAIHCCWENASASAAGSSQGTSRTGRAEHCGSGMRNTITVSTTRPTGRLWEPPTGSGLNLSPSFPRPPA